MEHDFLLSLIKFDFPSVKGFSELTDYNLLNYLKSKDKVKLESVSLDELETAIKAAVNIDGHEPGAELRIQAFLPAIRLRCGIRNENVLLKTILCFQPGSCVDYSSQLR